MQKNKSKGFTLIELLVAIAIVGILAGITLAMLSSARVKARDAQVKGTMDQMRKQAEIYYSINGNYGRQSYGYCANAWNDNQTHIFEQDTPEGLYPLLQEVAGVMQTNELGCYARIGLGAINYNIPARTWAVTARLPGGSVWCVDSTGFAGEPLLPANFLGIQTSSAGAHCKQI
ncbi:MAG: prepilin-type N-terminal cleavage/methylation domain-containing protein [Candidatus Pacebacteria bacterium]|nr:prepilin-type N-terminal cleavage/methylation domain-containing protein [Candidatus Paceibacterota bacterium]